MKKRKFEIRNYFWSIGASIYILSNLYIRKYLYTTIMVKREIIEINNRQFKSQNECKIYIRSVIKDLKVNEIIDENHIYFQLFNDLIQRHFLRDEKIGCGIKHFYVNLSAYKNKEMMIVRKDNSEIVFSWLRCIDKKHNSPMTNLLCAMRFEIKNQVLDFKHNYNPPYICSLCNNKFDVVEIDHKIDFKYLVNDFIQQNPNYPISFDNEPTNYHTAIFRNSDNDYAQKWNTFHKENAILQILCKLCHRNKLKDTQG